MKTSYLNQTKKSVAIVLALALGLTACKKDSSLNKNDGQSAFVGTWKLNDMMQVNNPDGQPRRGDGLAALNYTAIQLNSQGKFVAADAQSGNQVSGSWDANGEQLMLKKSDGETISLNIVSAKGDSLTLGQNYAATAGKASGTIYYALNR